MLLERPLADPLIEVADDWLLLKLVVIPDTDDWVPVVTPDVLEDKPDPVDEVRPPELDEIVVAFPTPLPDA